MISTVSAFAHAAFPFPATSASAAFRASHHGVRPYLIRSSETVGTSRVAWSYIAQLRLLWRRRRECHGFAPPSTPSMAQPRATNAPEKGGESGAMGSVGYEGAQNGTSERITALEKVYCKAAKVRSGWIGWYPSNATRIAGTTLR